MNDLVRFELGEYLARVSFHGSRTPSLETLRRLHLAHLAALPFENIDVLLGCPIRLDLASLQAKLVRSPRGGYCFEQNTLFVAALRELGFIASPLEARVRRPGGNRTRGRTHMVLRVEMDGQSLLADVGFGGDGPLEPVHLDGTVSEQAGDAYRVVLDGRVHVLRLRRDSVWRDLYAFTLDEPLPIDFEVANHYTSTHPASKFTRTLTAQLSLPNERRILLHRTYTVRSSGTERSREIADADVVPLLAEQFHIILPADTRIPRTPPILL